MENLTSLFIDYFVGFIESTFAEGYILLLIAGLLILLISLFIIVATLTPIIVGPTSIKGIVAGAVKPDIKRASTDEVVTIKKGVLFPVFQYNQDDGTAILIQGANGGTHVHKYKTGQHVDLIINNGGLFAEKGTAIDKGDMTGLYWGGGLLVLGAGLIYWASSALSTLSFGFITLILMAISFVVRNKMKINKDKVKQEKVFDLSKMKPVEEFERK